MTHEVRKYGYSMRVFWSEEDEQFIAVCPELQDISASGDTYEEAVRELQVAIEGAVEIYEESGWELPAPASTVDYSGQFRVRIARSLHARLAEEAEREGVSLNSLVQMKLADSAGVSAGVRRVVEKLCDRIDALSRQMMTGSVSTGRVAQQSKPRPASANASLAFGVGTGAGATFHGMQSALEKKGS